MEKSVLKTVLERQIEIRVTLQIYHVTRKMSPYRLVKRFFVIFFDIFEKSNVLPQIYICQEVSELSGLRIWKLMEGPSFIY